MINDQLINLNETLCRVLTSFTNSQHLKDKNASFVHIGCMVVTSLELCKEE